MKAIMKIPIKKLGAPTLSRFCTSAISKQQMEYDKKSTIDNQEIDNFSKLSDNWWDTEGEMIGLHAMNPLRVKFIRDGLFNTGFKETSPSLPLDGIKLLDVGCGGGILTEPLARIGAQVTGLDASKELINIATEHAALDDSLSSRLTFVNSSIEDFCQEKKEQYDAVVASEILEHVIDQELFIKSCIEVLKPKGSIFITTMNKNMISWLGGIVAAEYILKIVPMGTHDWNKFISPEETQQLLRKYNCRTKLLHGMIYNPLTNTWSWAPLTTINYALHAVKESSSANN